MSQQLYSIFDVAERLGLHVKTVRGYVQDGRLKATRIGKQYRIQRDDLEAFTGGKVPPLARETARRSRHVGVSSIVEIDAIDDESATRLSDTLKSSDALRIDTIYDEERARLKIIISGGAEATAIALRTIAFMAEAKP